MNFPVFEIDDIKMTVINHRVFVFTDEKGNPTNKAGLIEVKCEVPKGVIRKQKDGEYMNTINNQKKKTQKFLYKIDENSLNERHIDVYSEGYDGEEFTQIRLKFYEYEKEVGTFLFSNRQAWMLKDFLYYYYSGNEIEYNDVDITMLDNHVKVMMCLMNSTNYMITVQDLARVGIKKNTARVLLSKLVKRGLFQECNKVGNLKLYTATIPKEKLREMFVGKEGDEE